MGNSPVSTSNWHNRDNDCDTSGNITNTVPWFRFNPKFVGRIEKLDGPAGKPEAKSEQGVHTKQKRQCDHYPAGVKERHHQEHTVSNMLVGGQVEKEELSRKNRHKKCTHKNLLHTTISECELSTLRNNVITKQNVHPLEKSVFPVIYSEIQQRLDALKDSMVGFCDKVKGDIEKTTNVYTSALLGLKFNSFQTAPLELQGQVESSQWSPLSTAATALNYLGDFRNNGFKNPQNLINLEKKGLFPQAMAYHTLFNDGHKENDRSPEFVNSSKKYEEQIPTTDRTKQTPYKENRETQQQRIKRNNSYFNIHEAEKEITPTLLRMQLPKVINICDKNPDESRNPDWKNEESSKKDFGCHRHGFKKSSKRLYQEKSHPNGLKMCKTCTTTLKNNLKQTDILLKAHDLCFNQVKDNELDKKWPNVGNFSVIERNSLHQNNENLQPKSSRSHNHSMRKVMSIVPPNQGYFSHSRAHKLHKRVIIKELIAGTESMELENQKNSAWQKFHSKNDDIPRRMESHKENHISNINNYQHPNFIKSCDRSNFIEAKQQAVSQSKREKGECFFHSVPAKSRFNVETHLIESWPEIQRSQRGQRQRENYKKKISKFHSPLPNGIRDHGNWHRGDDLIDSGNFQKGDGIRNRNRESIKKPPEKFVKRVDNGKKPESRLTYL